MQKILYGALFLVTILVATSAPTPVTFEKTFGGKDDDLAKAVVETSDGYLIAGKSKSFSSHRDFDAYLIKIDHNGNKVWSKTYGGTRDEDANDIINYGMGAVFVGSTKTFGNQDKSFYINRISKKGSHIWRKAYFLDGDDEYTGSSIVTDGRSLTIAGTELHLGFTTSDVSPLVLQTNGGGKRIWEHYLGGRKKDFANKIIYTGDGYLVVGKTESYGHGDFDMYMIKLNKKGKWQWYNAFGGGDDDTANDVIDQRTVLDSHATMSSLSRPTKMARDSGRETMEATMPMRHMLSPEVLTVVLSLPAEQRVSTGAMVLISTSSKSMPTENSSGSVHTEAKATMPDTISSQQGMAISL